MKDRHRDNMARHRLGRFERRRGPYTFAEWHDHAHASRVPHTHHGLGHDAEAIDYTKGTDHEPHDH